MDWTWRLKGFAYTYFCNRCLNQFPMVVDWKAQRIVVLSFYCVYHNWCWNYFFIENRPAKTELSIALHLCWRLCFWYLKSKNSMWWLITIEFKIRGVLHLKSIFLIFICLPSSYFRIWGLCRWSCLLRRNIPRHRLICLILLQIRICSTSEQKRNNRQD